MALIKDWGDLNKCQPLKKMMTIGWEEDFSATLCFEPPQNSSPANAGTTTYIAFHTDVNIFVVIKTSDLNGDRPELAPVSKTK